MVTSRPTPSVHAVCSPFLSRVLAGGRILHSAAASTCCVGPSPPRAPATPAPPSRRTLLEEERRRRGAGADLQGMPGMHRHTLQFQTVEDIYMYFCKKENKKNIQEKMITQWPLLRPCRDDLFQARAATQREVHVVTPWRILIRTSLILGSTAPGSGHHSLIHPNCSFATCWLYVHAKPNCLQITMIKGYFLHYFLFSTNKFKK